MKRIRIGNDVIVRTSLDEFETDDKLKIKTLQCLFIKQKHNDKSDNDMCYEPSQYVYGCCGCCNYNAAVFNNGYNMPCTLGDPHWFPGYNGFGVNSNKFNCPKEYQSDVRVFDNYDFLIIQCVHIIAKCAIYTLNVRRERMRKTTPASIFAKLMIASVFCSSTAKLYEVHASEVAKYANMEINYTLYLAVLIGAIIYALFDFVGKRGKEVSHGLAGGRRPEQRLA